MMVIEVMQAMKVMDGMQVMEGEMKSLNWNGMIQTLVLVRLGQELGTDSRIARAVHDLFDAVLTVLR